MLSFLYILFQKIKHCIQSHGNNTQDHNGHKNPGEFKGLASIDDEISEAFPGTDELADDNTYQTEANVYFHNTDDQRKGSWQNNFCQFFFFVASQSFNQFQFFRICLAETGVQINNRTKDSHGHAGNYNGSFIGTQPYNQKRCKGRFRETVQYHKVRLQDSGSLWRTPEKNGSSHAQDYNKKETDKSFCQSNSDMGKQRLISAHGKKGFSDEGRTAENKGIDPSASGGHFPESHKQDKEKNPRCEDQMFFFFIL